MDGERLTQWEQRSVEAWRDRWGAPQLELYRSIGSTNDMARELAGAGSPAGTLVIAGAQTRGRGRRGRFWVSEEGQGLFLSMVVRADRQPPSPALTLRLGLAAALAIEEVAPVEVAVKWPNDLLIGSRKVAGILCEGAFEGAQAAHVVAGIGINVRQRYEDWPPDLAPSATSIAAEAARGDSAGEPGRGRSALDISPAAVADHLVPRWLPVGAMPAESLRETELQQLRSRDPLLGRTVTVDGQEVGTAAGTDRGGALLVQDGDVTRRVVSGTVRAVSGEPWEGAL